MNDHPTGPITLAPCPFCGVKDGAETGASGHSVAVVHRANRPEGFVPYWTVECDGCGAEGPAEDNADSAGASWNRRAGRPEAGEEVALADVIDRAWLQLSEVDDRTSPEEYPDMCLITRDELAGFITDGRSTPGLTREQIAHVLAFQSYRTAGNSGLPIRWAIESANTGWPQDLDEADAYLSEIDAAPAARQGDGAEAALDWLGANQNCELDYGYDEPDEGDPGRWRVHRVNGGRNDREWTLIGTGATPTAAILAAIAAGD